MPDSNRWNRTGHILLGIGAALIPGLDYYCALREIDQIPMENDEYPAVWIEVLEDGSRLARAMRTRWFNEKVVRTTEYWSAPRVLDSLNDTREVAIGKEIGRWVAWAWSAAIAVAVVTQAWLWAGFLIGAWLGLCAVGWFFVWAVDA